MYHSYYRGRVLNCVVVPARYAQLRQWTDDLHCWEQYQLPHGALASLTEFVYPYHLSCCGIHMQPLAGSKLLHSPPPSSSCTILQHCTTYCIVCWRCVWGGRSLILLNNTRMTKFHRFIPGVLKRKVLLNVKVVQRRQRDSTSKLSSLFAAPAEDFLARVFVVLLLLL